jgi:hypothetical protein
LTRIRLAGQQYVKEAYRLLKLSQPRKQ